ncbi:unnamed protein product [Onchocerca flexuosa]|uniref:Uncharacterized protein n=1 Tax=Onchocerca flexuosa TaxID=387005 RepID=A0A183HL06_9BILA|nr:unnamed protein product [Onchocerca flexuosa]
MIKGKSILRRLPSFRMIEKNVGYEYMWCNMNKANISKLYQEIQGLVISMSSVVDESSNSSCSRNNHQENNFEHEILIFFFF